ncbi:MAG: hypothetical protein ACRENP_19465 [Longimicrobiales bacterium]
MAADGNKGAATGQPRTRSRWETIRNWITGITAVLTLGFGLNQALQITSDTRERQRQIAEFQTVATQQRATGDFAAAWTSLEQALKVAETGGRLAKLFGQLSDERLAIRAAQEDLAMERLRNAQLLGQSWAMFVEQPAVILNRGVASASGARKADLLAHLGWATFLRSRDPASMDLDPVPLYQQAVQHDSVNPYAHAHWGHWLLWHKDTREEANQHFAAAASSGRALPYVRSMQLAAVKNLGSEGEAELLRVVDAMRQNNEVIDTQTRVDLYTRYSFACGLRHDSKRMAEFLAAVPAEAQLSTFRSLYYGEYEARLDEWKRMGRDACLGTLLEAAGQRDEALKVWQALRQNQRAQSNGMSARALVAIQRLSQRS